MARKGSRRVYYGMFRTWSDGELTGRSHANLMLRKSVRVNLNVEVFAKGKFPHYRKKDLEDSFTINVPLAVIVDLAREIKKTGVRVRKNAEHRWIKRRFKTGGVS